MKSGQPVSPAEELTSFMLGGEAASPMPSMAPMMLAIAWIPILMVWCGGCLGELLWPLLFGLYGAGTTAASGGTNVSTATLSALSARWVSPASAFAWRAVISLDFITELAALDSVPTIFAP